ncbi:hypothetical protein OSTOST_12606, partial [Ostertagia ostertagi]
NFNVDPICLGLDGVIEAFRKAQSVISPTRTAKFAPIVSYAIRFVGPLFSTARRLSRIDLPQFAFDDRELPTLLSPQLPRTDRRGSDSRYLDVEMGARTSLSVRVPERCHSVLQTTREQYQRRLKERGLGRMRFPRVDLSTFESSGSTQDSSL